MNSIKIISCCVVVFLLTSCGFQGGTERSSDISEDIVKDTIKVQVYFTKSVDDNISLVPLLRNVPKDDNVLDSVLRELFLGPTKKEMIKGIMSEIPVGTRLIKIEEGENDVLLDISSQYLVGGGAASVQLRYLQLYNTLKRIEPDKKFYLNVDGKPIKTIAGEGLEVTQPLTKINDYTKKYEKSDDLQP